MILELMVFGSKDEQETIREIRRIVIRENQGAPETLHGKREEHDTQPPR
jgi:hypothetical protein